MKGNKNPPNNQHLFIEINKQSGNFNYEEHIVEAKKKKDMFNSFKEYTLKNNNKNKGNNSNSTTIKSKEKQKIINEKPSIFDNLLEKKSEVKMTNPDLLLNKKRETKKIIKKSEKQKAKKNIHNEKKEKSFFLKAMGLDEEKLDKEYEERKRREKELKDKKSSEINKILQRNLMGNRSREFITQKEEEKERLEKQKEINNNINNNNNKVMQPNSFINSNRVNNMHKYSNFKISNNDIFKNVLSYNFYIEERLTEEIPNTFENEAHYRYIWVTNFLNELKYCLLNEKIEKSELQNYEKVNIRLHLLDLNDIDNSLSLLKINTNKKLNDLRIKILKDNDIIAIFNERDELDISKITLKNENKLNYFLGIVRKDYDNSDLNVYVLKEEYENFLRKERKNKKETTYKFYDKKVKFLGSINSPLREYKALLELKISNFKGIIKTESTFLSSAKENNENQNNMKTNNTTNLISKKDKFLNNLKYSIYNESQKAAIYKSNLMKKNDILLIQGPPGTGKTSTIIGLISLFLKNEPKSKILVCAPSNAGIDEICARLATKGVLDCDLKQEKCNFIRFGLYDRKDKEKRYLDTLNGKILEKYSLEYLSEQKFNNDLNTLSEKLENLRRQLNNYNEDKDKNLNNIQKVNEDINSCLKLYMHKKYQKIMYENDLLSSSQILCATLNNTGNERLKKIKLSFEYLIIDEASQSVEPSSLIPLCHDIQKLILVGDHMQLPATVFYPNAANILYNRSLFERFIDNKYQRHILTVQYRMEPNISKFISKVFYDNKLTNDETLSNCNKEPIYLLIKIEYNFSFFDISYGEELYEFDKKSYYNESEIEFSFRLIKCIISSIKNKINKLGENNNLENYNYDNSKEINANNENNKMIETLYNYKFAIICPYKSQVLKFREMKRKNKFFLNKNINDIEINTVDSFQGQERDIIIFSTVRANFKDDLLNKEEGEISSIEQNKNNVGIGFLNDYRRMNVGLSRAKFGCYVVGHYETLKNNSYWEQLINYCKDKKSFFKVDNTKESKQNSINNILI